MPTRSPISRFDTGWPLVLAGLALVAAVVLIPAWEQLEQTRFERDKLLAMLGEPLTMRKLIAIACIAVGIVLMAAPAKARVETPAIQGD